MARLTSLITLPFLALAIGACNTEAKTGNPNDGGNPESGPSTGGAAGGGAGGSSGAAGSTNGGSAGATDMHADRSKLKDVGTTKALDYSDPLLWLCLPGTTPNECLDNIDSTEILKDNTTKVTKVGAAENPDFDCFYVYPTVDLTGKGNVTDFSDISLILDPLLAQAAPFRQICKVYAPLYRQQSIMTGGTGDAGGGSLTGDATLADGDVADAFKYYMDNYNKGRRFVLMGHSQGTMKLIKLIADKIDGDAAMRNQLISAVLIGAPSLLLYAPTGKDVGGTFKNIKFCTTPGQVGCVVGFNSFAKEAPPPSNSVFGQAPSGNVVACTDPAMLADNKGSYTGSLLQVKLNQAIFTADTPMNMPPAVTTPFRLYRDLFKGACVNKNGYNYLEISVAQTSDDKRVVPPYRSTIIESVGFGLHVVDYAPPAEDLINVVKKQAAAAH